MIVGCYVLNLYCNGRVLRRRETNGPLVDEECFDRFDSSGTVRTLAEALREARARGWKVNVKADAVLCPACVANGGRVPRVIPDWDAKVRDDGAGGC